MQDSDDPFLPSDATQRPRPGAGRRGGPEPASPRPTAARLIEGEPIPAAARALLGLGLNPLVQAASPLLLLTGQLRVTNAAMDVSGLRRHALDEIRRFEEQARESGVRNEIVLAARYALCAGLDEAVLSTPWGAHSEWATHPLLVALHREAWGGEKFFEMLDRISADPARHIDLMELQYLGLALGFTGKYQMLDRGHEHLAQLQQDLYRKIRSQRGPAPTELSLRWRGLEDRRNRLIRYVPWWVVAAAALALLTVTFVVFYGRLVSRAEPLHAALAEVGVREYAAPPPAPIVGPTLKELLAPDEAARTMTVEEDDRRTVVTLRGGDLFGSGSAAVNPSYDVTLQHLAAALAKVPGSVEIVGHTDNTPVKSVGIAGNFALSRERAVSVANALKRSIGGPVWISARGVGSTRPLPPLPPPATEAENLARNRRVEIIHSRR